MEAEENATEDISSYTNASREDTEAYIRRTRERQAILRAKAEQETTEARKKYWEEYEKRKITEEENRSKQTKINTSMSKISDQISDITKSCDSNANGNCADKIAKMKKAAAALKHKLTAETSTPTV